MIKVEFKKPAPSDQFNDWLTRCEAAAKKLKSAKDVKEKLYKEQRQFFLDLFHGKCAYCEAKIILDQHKGDVEHYRPKGGVTDENDNAIEVDNGHGGKRPHGGYYWLAYSLENLLPSCIACNRPDASGDRRVGKWNRFPVAGKHASMPAEIADEKPLLLNPLLAEDDPTQHLEFDSETGRIIGKTERGQMTVCVLNLNREGLPDARRDAYDSVVLRSQAAYSPRLRRDSKTVNRYVEFMLQHKNGQAEYAMAGRPAVALSGEAVQDLSRQIA